MKAIWAMDYDFRQDKCFNRPSCPECQEPIIKREDGKYHCLCCGKEVDVKDPEMQEWLAIREEVKTEYEDCHIIKDKDGNHIAGCGGEKCVETHYMRNPITLKWQVMGGKCKLCGSIFIV